MTATVNPGTKDYVIRADSLSRYYAAVCQEITSLVEDLVQVDRFRLMEVRWELSCILGDIALYSHGPHGAYDRADYETAIRCYLPTLPIGEINALWHAVVGVFRGHFGIPEEPCRLLFNINDDVIRFCIRKERTNDPICDQHP